MDTQERKTVQEAEAPVVNTAVDYDKVDLDPKRERPRGREYLKARSTMPEEQLFSFAEYNAQEAEKIGYSNYSYWKSVWANFLKKKPAVIMSIIFILLFIFTFVASAIGKYDIHMAPDPLNRMYISPNSEYWFGTNAIGQDYWAMVWYATRASILLAVLVSLGQVSLGVIIGLIWGYVRKLDRFFTELYNLIDNVPTIIYMTLIALMVGKTMLTMGIAMVRHGGLRMAGYGPERPQPGVHVPRPGVQPGLPVSWHQAGADPVQEHLPLPGQRHHPAAGVGHPRYHRLRDHPHLSRSHGYHGAVPGQPPVRRPGRVPAGRIHPVVPGGHRFHHHHHLLPGGQCVLRRL